MNWADFIIAEKAGLVANKKTVDNIQTTSRATLSTAGWYRVARIKDTSFKTFQFIITRAWNNQAPETYVLRYTSGGSNVARFECLSALCGIQYVSKVRLTTDGTYQYLEIYYAQSKENLVAFAINDLNMATWFPTYWEMYSTPTLTSETVDGVTVTTTYDIPANASPVIISKSYGADVFGSTDVDTWRTVGCYGCKASYTNYPPSTDGWGDVIVFESLNSITVQLFHSWNKTELLAFRGTDSNGAWGNWQTFSTTADLANYLPIGDSDGLTTNMLRFGNKWAFMEKSGNHVNLGIKSNTNGAIDNNNMRYLQIMSNTEKSSVKDALSIADMVNGTTTQYILLHTGNSAKVVVSETAPTDTSALWVW